VDLSNGEGFEEIQQVRQYLSDYKSIVLDGLYPDRVMFSGNSLSAKKLYLLYNRDSVHYNVIANLKGAMPKKYICNGCDTLYDHTHKCDKVCSLRTATPPCTKDQSNYCCTRNICFLSEKCFQNHLILKVKGKLVCQWRRVCRNCSYLVTSDSKHECFNKFCTFCNKKEHLRHLWYVAPLKPSKMSNKYLCVFIRSVHKTLKIVMGLLSMFRNSLVLSRCVLNVKPWMMLTSIVNSVDACPHVLARPSR